MSKMRIMDITEEWLDPLVPAQQDAAVYWVLFDATGPVPYIKKSSGDGFLAFFDNEEDAKRAKRQHHGTDYKRVEYFRAPPALAVAALVEALERAEQVMWSAECNLDVEAQEIQQVLIRYRATLAGKGGE